MPKLPASLDMDALRSFVMGMDSGNFAQTARRLCRSTSAVSAQLKKLEQQCGSALVVKRGRHLALTPTGELLMSYARRILAINDEALLAVKGELLHGEVRLGMSEDFGESLMPAILGKFNRRYPALRITARVDRLRGLVNGIRESTLDMALAWQPDDTPPESHRITHLPLQWISHPATDIGALIARQEPVPLVMFDAPCQMRTRAIAALDGQGIPWRIVFASHSLGGIWAAVRSGLGITLRSPIGMPDSLRVLSESVLPAPGTMGVALLHADAPAAGTLASLRELLVDEVLNGV